MWFNFLLIVASLAAEPIKVAVIDTGLDVMDVRLYQKLCNSELHRDFTGTGLIDTIGHGTHVVGLIEEYAKKANYCLVILKFFDENAKPQVNFERFLRALNYAASIKVKYVNISGGGPVSDDRERVAIAAHPKITYVVAAGNDHENLDDSKKKWYPASYALKNMKVVGGLAENGHSPMHWSNYGSIVTDWERGERVMSTLPYGSVGIHSGTSMACAIKTGKLLYENASGPL